ncbi:amino acid ABC transporter permease [Labrys monachus]|uniref:His/Glu/Gln/Arg/opine family amino acid ABC transporter permease subunit n=1 Tax=Labrys monachus TaxID=217067 RepID=A0ABU0FFB4_9HYPH|nr:amino acid ABC transporter permease [Labrys monachus]MDQ0392808.1 His/Glu/Gln/Arg/opine family amino acid ABC transporter permease subunit [Labrys monachus]
MIDFVTSYTQLYVTGALVGLGLALLSFAGSLAIGLAAALGRISSRRWLRLLTGAYVALFRGVPPLVLLYIVYFGLPAWAHQTGDAALIALLSPLDNRLLAATVAFAINSGAYSTEIFRASILSVQADQMEAARSLGMSYALGMRRIVLPQALRIAVPPLSNELIIVLKGTSLASVIGVSELMRNAQTAASATFQNLIAYSYAAVFYVVFVIVLQSLVRILAPR